MQKADPIDNDLEKLSLNFVIVGAGRTCRAFLELLQEKSPKYLNVHIIGICDIDPKAEGFLLARKMGIYTTTSCSDLFMLEGIDAVLELTNNEALPEILQHRPPGMAVIEHDAGRLLETFFGISEKLASAQQRINLEMQSYDVLFQQTNLGIVVLNPNFTIVDANSTYLQAVKKTREEAVGRLCHEIVKGVAAPCSFPQIASECPVAKTLRTGKSAIAIQEHTISENQTNYFNIATYPIKDKNGTIIRIIEVWKEITKEISSRWEKRMERVESNMRRMIQEDRMISMGRLAASCVHEINNPIQGLLTFSRLMETILAEGALSLESLQDLKKYTGLMSQELERCGDIISGLLSFSRESSVEYRQVDLNDIMASVISLTRHKMELLNIFPKVQLSPEPLNVVGDKNQLQQCFLNIIFNALEAMPEGGKLFVVCQPRGEDGSRIEIRDTGSGITEKDLNHIFDPFFTTKEQGQGIGLGLSIVYGLIKSHKGEINVESRIGEGTSFTLTFPGPQRGENGEG